MRIVINVLPLLSPLTGIGQYTSQLVRQFGLVAPHNDYTYYHGYFSRRLPLAEGPTVLAKKSLWKIPFVRPFARKLSRIFSSMHLRKFDLYFEPNFIPLNMRAERLVTTIHDFSLQLFPETHPRDRVNVFLRHFQTNIGRAHRIITDSAYVREQARTYLNIPDEKISCIHLGIAHELFRKYDADILDIVRKHFKLPEKFILFVSSGERRKNFVGFACAFGGLPEALKRDFQIVLVGPTPAKPQLLGSVAEKLFENALNLGYVDDQTLAYLYNLASLLVYPSLYEGFGLPTLEAMACGCPVIASRVASLPEICADAAYYIDPNDTESIANGISNVLCDNGLRRSLVEKGSERAKLFTWEKTAEKTLEVFHEVLSVAN